MNQIDSTFSHIVDHDSGTFILKIDGNKELGQPWTVTIPIANAKQYFQMVLSDLNGIPVKTTAANPQAARQNQPQQQPSQPSPMMGDQFE